MTQLIRLDFNKHSDGQVNVRLTITDEQDTKEVKTGQLPSPLSVLGTYQSWRLSYQSIRVGQRVIVPDSVGDYDSAYSQQPSQQQISPEVCKQKSHKFQQAFNDWLKSKDFIHIRESIAQALNQLGDSRFVVCTDDKGLQQLPWCLWELLANEYPTIEVGLSGQSYRRRTSVDFPMQGNKVKVLAILGDSTGIDIEEDRRFFTDLPQADVQFLPTPRRSALKAQLWNQGWDVLFFAGHSHSREGTGQLQLNQNDVLSIDVFQNTLRELVKNGLTLAIFNSCDGIGLARTLAALEIPYIIVMREPVPDIVAQTFLRYFLESFTSGQSFHAAVGIARKQLEGEQDELPPFGDWMPVLWQNPLVAPPVWPQSRQYYAKIRQRQLGTRALATVGVTAAVMALRWFGLLQGIELTAYDRLLRSRPPDGMDKNILIVRITEEERYSPDKSITDADLEKLLDMLYAANPRIVGLDIFRDFAVAPGHERLSQYFAEGDRLITVCGVSSALVNKDEIPPAPDADPEGLSFSDINSDYDRIYRRHLLEMDSQAGDCSVNYSFAALVAYNYLIADSTTEIELDANTGSDLWTWGKQKIPLLQPHQGGYHDEAMEETSILLSYRMSARPEESPFESVTLRQVLDGKVPASSIQDRAVLIGVDATSLADRVLTPLHDKLGKKKEISGVEYHAHAVSQLIDIVMGDRLLLKPLPIWGDVVYICVWVGVGSLLAWRQKQLTIVLLASGGAVGFGYGVSWLGLVGLGIWLPLVPSVITLASGSILSFLLRQLSHKTPFKHK